MNENVNPHVNAHVDVNARANVDIEISLNFSSATHLNFFKGPCACARAANAQASLFCSSGPCFHVRFNKSLENFENCLFWPG